ncbi:hypothetical protein [Mesobacterium pallidum]|nr:hypothetical protein [Mesobacterium pallidum]
MLRTINVGNYISIQGQFVQTLSDGRVSVRVGNQVYTGKPVGSTKAA